MQGFGRRGSVPAVIMEGMTTETAIVVGQGYVGLPLAMRAVAAGYDVVGYDVDEHRSKALAAGTSFVEDIADAEVAEALATGRYRAVATLEGVERFDVAVITVPTPLREGIPDLTFIDDAGAPARPAAHPRAPRSCSRAPPTPAPPRSGWPRSSRQGSGLRAGADFHLGYSPGAHRPRQPDLHARQHARRW